MERINETIKLIPEHLRKDTEGLKPISSFLINPSHDFNAMAVDYFSDLPLSIRLLLRSVGITNDSESSMVSYLLFEKNYCRQLIKLGFEDAMEKETAIRKFLSLD